MTTKIVVEWNFDEKTLYEHRDYIRKERLWDEKIYDALPYERLTEVIFDNIWDDEVIMEDRGGDIHFSRDEVLDIWEEKKKDEDFALDEEAEEPMQIIDFAKFIRSLPEGAYVHVRYNYQEKEDLR
jgi:hypothetical protein